MKRTSLMEMQRLDRRAMRAHALVAQIMHIVGKHFSREDDARKAQRDLSRELFDEFHEMGVEIISDYTRAEIGLPPRGPDGWTVEEIIELERRRLEVMRAPLIFKNKSR